MAIQAKRKGRSRLYLSSAVMTLGSGRDLAGSVSSAAVTAYFMSWQVKHSSDPSMGTVSRYLSPLYTSWQETQLTWPPGS